MDVMMFAWPVVIAGIAAPVSWLLHAQLLFCVLGAASALSLPALGGASVTAPWLFSAFLIARAWLARPSGQSSFVLSRASLWICLVAVWGTVSSYYLPRWLEGEVYILTIDRSIGATRPDLLPLRPVSGNVTQSVYALGGALAFMAMRTLIQRTSSGLSHFRDAALWLGAVNCACGVLNLAEFYAGFPALLPYVRTGAYRIFESYEAGGLVRIQGTFAETAAFSAFSLPLFVFALQLWLRSERPRVSGAVAALSLALLLMSTSATAYLSLLCYAALLVSIVVWKAARGEPIRRLRSSLMLVLAACTVLGLLYGLRLGPGIAIERFIESTLLHKMDSVSGIERSAWNAHAWENFLGTYGAGVGLGGARASSFILVLLSNVGVVGTLLFTGFVYEVLRPRPDPERSPIAEAARHATIATLIAAVISCPVFDMGFWFYAFSAAATCSARRQPALGVHREVRSESLRAAASDYRTA